MFFIYYISNPADFKKGNGLPAFREGNAGDIVAYHEGPTEPDPADIPFGVEYLSFPQVKPILDAKTFKVNVKVDPESKQLVLI